MSGQRGHFVQHAPKGGDTYALDRYSKETDRLHSVLDRQLAGREYIAGAYSIADMACYPWCVSAKRYGTDYAKYANVRAWMDRMAARPGVKAAYDKGKPFENQRASDEDAKKILYGQTAESVAGMAKR
jgi:GSH-dependent disulfide-bond oxidoreductase